MNGECEEKVREVRENEELREKMRAFFTHLLGRPVDDTELERLLKGAADGDGRFKTERLLH